MPGSRDWVRREAEWKALPCNNQETPGPSCYSCSQCSAASQCSATGKEGGGWGVGKRYGRISDVREGGRDWEDSDVREGGRDWEDSDVREGGRGRERYRG